MAVNWTNVTSWNDVLATANTNSGSWFWTFIMYGIFLVALLIFSAWGFEVALLISAFIGLLLGILLVYAGLVSWTWTLTFVGIILFSFLYIAWSCKKQ